MSPLEATVRLIENWNVTGKLADMNVGQVYDLTESLFSLFNQKPKTRPKLADKAVETPTPVEGVQW